LRINGDDKVEETSEERRVRVAGLLDGLATALFAGLALLAATYGQYTKSTYELERDKNYNIPSGDGDGKSSERDSNKGLSEHFWS
jgi:hypothetical protein